MLYLGAQVFSVQHLSSDLIFIICVSHRLVDWAVTNKAGNSKKCVLGPLSSLRVQEVWWHCTGPLVTAHLLSLDKVTHYQSQSSKVQTGLESRIWSEPLLSVANLLLWATECNPSREQYSSLADKSCKVEKTKKNNPSLVEKKTPIIGFENLLHYKISWHFGRQSITNLFVSYFLYKLWWLWFVWLRCKFSPLSTFFCVVSIPAQTNEPPICLIWSEWW